MSDQPESADPTDVRVLACKLADAPELAGREFVGDWFTVERDKIPLFDEATYTDTNAFEVDESGYPDDLIEGFHLLALLDHLINPVVHVTDGPWVAWNYGLDRVRFVSPVRAGEYMRVRGSVSSVEPRDEGFLLVLDCTVEVQNRERPGFVAVSRVLWLPGS